MKYILMVWCFLFSSLVYAEKHILIFVSFSMPKASLIRWSKDAKIIGAPVILRGLVNNSFKDTTHAIYAVVKETGSGFQIDPLLFSQFDIQKVPAVVITTCDDLKSCHEDFKVFYGDIPLEYTLHQISQEENAYSSIAENALMRLKEASHE